MSRKYIFNCLETMAFGLDTDRVLKQLGSGANELNLDYFDIVKLPNPLPAGLRALRCSETKITELPPLPEGLEILIICYVAGLTSINKLPSTLKVLDCWGTPLKGLPQLPDGLKELVCGRTKITCLPPQPDSLEILRCSDTDIKYIPKLSLSLKNLNAGGSKLMKLPETVPYWLETLNLEGSCVTELPKNLPPYLTTLAINKTMISELPPLPDSLRNLYIERTLIKTLSKPLPKNLENIDCSRDLAEDIFAGILPLSIKSIGCSCVYLKGKAIYDEGCFDCYYTKNCSGSYSDAYFTWYNSRCVDRAQERAYLIKTELIKAVYKPCFAY